MNTAENEVVKIITAIKEEYLEILDDKIGHSEGVSSALQLEGRYDLARDNKRERSAFREARSAFSSMIDELLGNPPDDVKTAVTSIKDRYLEILQQKIAHATNMRLQMMHEDAGDIAYDYKMERNGFKEAESAFLAMINTYLRTY